VVQFTTRGRRRSGKLALTEHLGQRGQDVSRGVRTAAQGRAIGTWLEPFRES
jgi:hypothetical protein